MPPGNPEMVLRKQRTHRHDSWSVKQDSNPWVTQSIIPIAVTLLTVQNIFSVELKNKISYRCQLRTENIARSVKWLATG
jgi:hypothetical protein